MSTDVGSWNGTFDVTGHCGGRIRVRVRVTGVFRSFSGVCSRFMGGFLFLVWGLGVWFGVWFGGLVWGLFFVVLF